MTGPEFDAHKIVEILDRYHVDYVLVGGFAAVLYGSRRPTEDIDITPATSPDNLHRLSQALRALDARIRVDGVAEGLAFDTSVEALLGMTMLNLRTAFAKATANRPKDQEALPELEALARRLRHHGPGRPPQIRT